MNNNKTFREKFNIICCYCSLLLLSMLPFFANSKSQHRALENYFSGFYFGIGGVYNQIQYAYTGGPNSLEAPTPTQYANQAQMLLQLGYGYLWRQHYYLGIEYAYYLPANKHAFNHSGTYYIQFHQDNFRTLLLTPGFLFSNAARHGELKAKARSPR